MLGFRINQGGVGPVPQEAQHCCSERAIEADAQSSAHLKSDALQGVFLMTFPLH